MNNRTPTARIDKKSTNKCPCSSVDTGSAPVPDSGALAAVSAGLSGPTGGVGSGETIGGEAGVAPDGEVTWASCLLWLEVAGSLG